MSANSPLLVDVRPGLQALGGDAKGKVVPEPAGFVTDSLALDEALKAKEADSPRWDYWLGTTERGKPLLAVEVHPAKPMEVTRVIAKKKWAMDKAKEHLRPGQRVAEWVWIASGGVQIAPTTTEYKRLVKEGIRLVGHLRVTEPNR